MLSLRLLPALALALLLPAVAQARVHGPAPADRPAVHLLAPADGATLQGGGKTLIAWEMPAGLEPPPGAFEWEAFLSIDGGRSFALRVTPHLDLARKRFAFPVPNLRADDVAILLRVGNERKEISVPVAGRWKIAHDPTRISDESRVRWSHRPGEKARPGDAGVVAWVEEKDGEALEVRFLPPAHLRRHVAHLGRSLPSLASDAPQPRPRLQAFLPRGGQRDRHTRVALPSPSSEELPSRPSPRLLESRFNE